MASGIDILSIRAAVPLFGLFLLGILIFILDLALKKDRPHWISFVTMAGLALTAIAAVMWGLPQAEGSLVFGGMLRHDWLAFAFMLVFLFGGAITALLMRDYPEAGNRGEFYLLMVVSILGMTLMAAAADLVMLFLAIETTSIPLYILAGFLRHDARSTEAGFKYLLYGAMTSAIMLYGFSLLFGFSGTTRIYEIAARLGVNAVSPVITAGVIILILAGISFKISAVPFHFWAPDVYEGAPSPVTGFLSTASKAAGFSVLLRLLFVAFPSEGSSWGLIVMLLSVASMTFGNLQAINQKNIKRLLAYSSIAQAGYILIGVAAGTPLGNSGVIFYLMAYLVTNLAAFAIVTIIGRMLGSDEIKAYAGLSRRSPGLALGLLAAFLSLGGIPPFAGFFGKVVLFSAAMQAGLEWLAIVGIINSVFALYYYLVVMKVVYLDRSEGDEQPLKVAAYQRLALLVCVAGVIIAGVFFTPFFELSRTAAAALF